MHRFMPRPLSLASTLMLTAAILFPASALADDEARRAILDLRQQVKQMQDQNQQARFLLADQIQALQHELAQMRGQLERIQFELDVSKGNSPGQPGSSTKVDNPREQLAFDDAMAQFRSGKYKEAAQGLTDFLSNYPASQLAGDARFYLGSSLYAIKDFKGSVTQLQQLVKEDPADARAADALLIITASKIELNDMAGAKGNLQKIIRDYPDSAAADTAKSRLELLQ